MITALSAAKAYAAAQKSIGVDESFGTSGPAAPAQGGFGDILKSAMTDAISAYQEIMRMPL